MTRPHIIISGTGRAGTTFLVQLFTALGLDTGFTDFTADVFANCDAGMEWDLRDPQAPYIVKSPWLCDYLDEALTGGEVVVEHALVPVRDLYSAAESRRDVTRRSRPAGVEGLPDVPGGLWHTEEPERQEEVLAVQLHKLMYCLARWDIPVTLLLFPRIVQDPWYLYRKVTCVLEGASFERFSTAFAQVARPGLVHDFGAGEPPP